MLSARLTEPKWAVYSGDPALKNAKPDELRDYMTTRDMSKFADMASWPEQPTKFQMAPFLTTYQHLFPDFESIFQVMVKDVQNGPVSSADFELIPGDTTGGKRLTKEAVNKLPLEAVLEMGMFCYNMASKDGVTSPFTWQAGALAEQLKAHRMLDAANARLIMTANEPDSES